jgi:hypothetical protein
MHANDGCLPEFHEVDLFDEGASPGSAASANPESIVITVEMTWFIEISASKAQALGVIADSMSLKQSFNTGPPFQIEMSH